jgi:hypothetical protein
MEKHTKSPEKTPKSLDTVSEGMPIETGNAEVSREFAQPPLLPRKKQPRGRPRKIIPTWVTGRAYDFRIPLAQVWGKLNEPLLAAKTEEEVQRAFEENSQPYASHFVQDRVSDVFTLP